MCNHIHFPHLTSDCFGSRCGFSWADAEETRSIAFSCRRAEPKRCTRTIRITSGPHEGKPRSRRRSYGRQHYRTRLKSDFIRIEEFRRMPTARFQNLLVHSFFTGWHVGQCFQPTQRNPRSSHRSAAGVFSKHLGDWRSLSISGCVGSSGVPSSFLRYGNRPQHRRADFLIASTGQPLATCSQN